MRQEERSSPSIHIYYHQDVAFPRFEPLLYGLEEEGIPFHIEIKNEHDPINLGYVAAMSSNLGVGIGINHLGGGVVHYNKLPETSPLFKFHLRMNKAELRMIGANAARIVKNIPFKDEQEQAVEEQTPSLSKSEIALIVRTVIERLTSMQ